MIEAERRNRGLGTDSSEEESGKEEFVLQDLGVEELEDRRIGDEIEHDGGFGGIEALIRKCIMDRRNIFYLRDPLNIVDCHIVKCHGVKIHDHYHHHR